MEKPGKKLKTILLTIGITGAVYGSFKYLLPLVIPFLAAYLFALLLRPTTLWLEKHTRLHIKNREFHIPLSVLGGAQILLLVILLGAGLYIGGKKLFLEAQLLIDNLPAMIAALDSWLTGCCFFAERAFGLRQGYLVRLLQEMLRGLGKSLRDTAMPYLMVNSMTVFRGMIETTVITVIVFIATILSLQEMDELRRKRDSSIFHEEYAMLSRRLSAVGNAYIKTQGSIMLLTMVVCTIGLFLMGNPYSIMLGIFIGLLDALPIFGTGTVLIPWAVFNAVGGQWLRAGILMAIYIICYFLREILEAKMMGGKVGLSSLETLIAMYVGLQLFGLLGFLLGPVGLILIKDAVEQFVT